MKKIIYCLSLLLSVMSLTSCEDFFDPETDDMLDGQDYIGSETEMYTGFIGIMTKMQAVGDKEILLTETRGNLIEVTESSKPELIALYNYESNLDGNSYANPAGYYEVIMACNDYLVKMLEYRNAPGVDEEIWKNLVSSTVRCKVWAYKTLIGIYGEAVWIDDPVTKLTELTPENGFIPMSLENVVDKCIDLLKLGYAGVPADRTIDWIAWLDPANVTNASNSIYRKWNYMLPPYEGLYAELCLWKAATIESLNPNSPTEPDAAKGYYQEAADVLLQAIGYYVDLKYASSQSDPGSNVYWLPSGATRGHYSAIYDRAEPYYFECVSALIYDYTKNQVNTLLKHFSNEAPNEYLLRPSQYGIDYFLEHTTSSDARYKCTFGTNAGQNYIGKFRKVGSSARANAYQDDVHIYLYRATQYHSMLSEALNHLGRFEAMNGVFNSGVTKEIYDAESPEWAGFSKNWTADAEWGNRKNPSMGIRGCYEASSLPMITSIIGTTEHDAMKTNDLLMLDECMLEFACEGKVYPMMNRMALRYGDLNIVADRVAPKYAASGKEANVRASILGGGNWVKYDLRLNE